MQDEKSERPGPDVFQAGEHHGQDRRSSKILDIIYWVPPWCRWSTTNPPPFTIWLNILYAVAGGFTSANLHYTAPILAVLARDFKTNQAGVSNIPTLALAGESTCLLLLLPLGDFFPRRKFVLTLIALAAAFWIGLPITNDLIVFEVLTFLSACFTGSTQVMIPLVSELSTDDNRAFNISIVAAGPTLGIMLARILSGVVANYTSWHNVYWMALGLQGFVLVALFLLMPDYPAPNPEPVRRIIKDYPRILWSIVTLYFKHPILVQVSLISMCTFITVTSFWTTLTFLLTGSPYHYNTVDIGLFGLIGAATMVLGPLYGRFIVKPLKQPLLSVMIGKLANLTGAIVGTFSGTHTVAGPILQAVFLDAGLMIVQISNRMSLHGVEPKARNRVNTAFVVVMYIGMLVGAKAGNVIYQDHGGWIASGSLSIGVLVFSFVFILARGPNEQGWIGWRGGGWTTDGTLAGADADADAEQARTETGNEVGLKDLVLEKEPTRGYRRRSETSANGSIENELRRKISVASAEAQSHSAV